MDWTDIGSIATAVGVFLGVMQIRQNSHLRRAQYEDSFDQQYRELAMEIPVDALIGKPVHESLKVKVRELVYNYLDLSNEQVYQRTKKRIAKDTWADWCTGIKENLERPAFKHVWEEVKTEAPHTFTFLEALENTHFAMDPASRMFLTSVP